MANGYNNNSGQQGGISQQQYQQIMMLANEGAKNKGRPDRPAFDSLLGQDGLIGQPYQIQNQLTQGALGQLQQEAMRAPGDPSQWRQLMDQQVIGQAGQAAAGAQSQMQNAMSNLAMRGGLRSGAGERMAQQAANQATMARQGALGQRLGLDIQDEQMRQQMLAQAGQRQMGAAEFDIKNSLNEVLQKRAEDINAYNEQMRAWASERTAAATPSGGGGGKK